MKKIDGLWAAVLLLGSAVPRGADLDAGNPTPREYRRSRLLARLTRSRQAVIVRAISAPQISRYS